MTTMPVKPPRADAVDAPSVLLASYDDKSSFGAEPFVLYRTVFEYNTIVNTQPQYYQLFVNPVVNIFA